MGKGVFLRLNHYQTQSEIAHETSEEVMNATHEGHTEMPLAHQAYQRGYQALHHSTKGEHEKAGKMHRAAANLHRAAADRLKDRVGDWTTPTINYRLGLHAKAAEHHDEAAAKHEALCGSCESESKSFDPHTSTGDQMSTTKATRSELDEARDALKRLESVNLGLKQPKEGAEQVERMLTDQKAPAHVKALGSKPFSFHRFIKFLSTADERHAPHEVDTLRRYQKALEETSCGLANYDTGWWLPMSWETYGGRLTSTTKAEDNFHYVKSVFGATNPQYDPDEAAWLAKHRIVKAQSAYDDALGGSLVAPPVMGEPIPLVRPQAAFLAAGSQAFTLPPNGRYVRPRILTPPNVKAVGESQDTETSDLGTGQMELTAKKIAGAVILTEEGTAFTSGTLDNIAQSELSRSLGLKLDAFGFYGTGGTQIPSGLTHANYASQIYKVETENPTARGIGADGNQLLPQYGDIFPALIGEQSFNMDANTGAWIMRPAIYATAASRRADAVAAGDAAGPSVDILKKFDSSSPTMFRGRKVVQTTNIRNDYTKNAGTSLSDVFYGIWQYAVFASYGAIQFQQGHNGNTFLRGQVIIRGTMYGDIGFEYPNAFLWYENVQGIATDW